MKKLCLFCNSNYPDSGLLGLFDDVDRDLQNIRSASPDVSYKICAIYSTNIQSLDAVNRLFGATFGTTPSYSMIDGVLHILIPVNQAISWLQDIAKFTGTESSLQVFSDKEPAAEEARSKSDNHMSIQNVDFENEDSKFVPDDVSHTGSQTTSIEPNFTLTLRGVKASRLSGDAVYSTINTVNKDTIKDFLNSKGYGLTDDNFVCSVDGHTDIEYLFYLPTTTFNVSWVLALNDSFRKKVYVFKIPDNIDLSGRARYSQHNVSSLPIPFIIPAGNPNFPCGNSRIELKRFIDKTYEYNEILQTQIPVSTSSYRLVSISFLGTNCEVNSWLDVFCKVLDVLCSAKPASFVSNLKKFLNDTDLFNTEPDSKHASEFHYVDGIGAKVWIKIPQSEEKIVSFLKKAFNAFDIRLELLEIEFSGNNPFTGTDNSIDPDEIENKEKTSSRKKREDKFKLEEPIEFSLDDVPDLSRKKLVYVTYDETQYPIHSWSDLLRAVFITIDDLHPEQLRELASHNVNPTSSSTYPYLLLDKNLVPAPDKFEQLPNSGAYFITNLSANYTIKFINYVFKCLNINASGLVMAYSGGKGRTTLQAEPSNSTYDEKTETEDLSSQSKSKSVIVKYLKQHGYTPRGANITKAKALRGAYWATPRPQIFKRDWTLILDDTINKKYYIFEIPKGKIDTKDLKWWSNHKKYYINIPYDDKTFTDAKSGKVRFDKFKTTEFDYSIERPSDAHKEPEEETTIAGNGDITLTPLSQIPDGFNSHKIAYFEFRGASYEAEHWKDALDEVVDYLYKKHPDDIYSLAYNNVGLDLKTTDSKSPFFSLDKDVFTSEDFAHHVKGTEIYFRTNYSVTIIINRCIKGLLDLFNEDLDQLIFGYY